MKGMGIGSSIALWMGGGSIDYEKDLSDDSIRFLFSKGVLSRVFDFAVSEQIKGNILRRK